MPLKSQFKSLDVSGGFPSYVRKLVRKSAWGDPSDAPQYRVGEAARRIFPSEELEHSTYLASSPEDLKKIFIGMNSRRDVLHESIDFVAFKEEEIKEAGFSIIHNKGETECSCANELHYDLSATDSSCGVKLCRLAINKDRAAFRITKGQAKQIIQELTEIGCDVFGGVGNCSVKA